MKRYALPIILASTLLAQAVSAQTSSTTPIIGYYKQTFPVVGVYSVSVGFTAKKDFQGAMTSSTPGATTAIEQTGATFGTFDNHYVEILSGSNTGLILDIATNDSDTINVTGNVPLAAGTTYCVRHHVTLGNLLGASSGVGADTDLVILFDPAGNEINALYSGGIWQDVSTLADLSDYPIYPGQGFLFLPGEDGRTLTIGGGEISYVKSGSTRVSLTSGVPTLVGLINPLVATDPLDPIYSSSAVNTLTQFGLRVDPPVAGLGMAADSDLAVVFSDDGALTDSYNVLLDGASNNLVDAITSANLNATQIRNGQALLYIPGSDYSFVLPQRHP